MRIIELTGSRSLNLLISASAAFLIEESIIVISISFKALTCLLSVAEKLFEFVVEFHLHNRLSRMIIMSCVDNIKVVIIK